MVRGLIRKLFLALAKEVRSEVLADWVARSSISSVRYSEGALMGEEQWLEVMCLKVVEVATRGVVGCRFKLGWFWQPGAFLNLNLRT